MMMIMVSIGNTESVHGFSAESRKRENVCDPVLVAASDRYVSFSVYLNLIAKANGSYDNFEMELQYIQHKLDTGVQSSVSSI
jgi:hypothetical protein